MPLIKSDFLQICCARGVPDEMFFQRNVLSKGDILSGSIVGGADDFKT